MTTDIAQNIADDGADAAETTEAVTAIGQSISNRWWHRRRRPSLPDSDAGRADQVFPAH